MSDALTRRPDKADEASADGGGDTPKSENHGGLSEGDVVLKSSDGGPNDTKSVCHNPLPPSSNYSPQADQRPPSGDNLTRPSLAEVQEAEREEHASALRFVLDRACAAETLVEDILDLVAAFNPDAVGAWRDQSAIAWQRILDGDCDPSEVSQRSLYQTRFEILEAVMVRAGQPYEAAEIVDLADARAKAAVRQPRTH